MSSILASRNTKTIPIPFDPPHEAMIQQLSGKQLQRAADVNVTRTFEGIKERGGAQVIKEMQQLFGKVESDASAAKALEQAKANPLNGYDKHTVVKAGLKAWTIPDTPLTDAAIEDLHDEAVDYFATEIMRLTKPGLFHTELQAEAAQKND